MRSIFMFMFGFVFLLPLTLIFLFELAAQPQAASEKTYTMEECNFRFNIPENYTLFEQGKTHVELHAKDTGLFFVYCKKNLKRSNRTEQIIATLAASPKESRSFDVTSIPVGQGMTMTRFIRTMKVKERSVYTVAAYTADRNLEFWVHYLPADKLKRELNVASPNDPVAPDEIARFDGLIKSIRFINPPAPALSESALVQRFMFVLVVLILLLLILSFYMFYKYRLRKKAS